MIRSLVTGGAGFIGSHLVRHLLATGHHDDQVVALDDLSGGFIQNLPRDPRLHFVEGSIVDNRLVDGLFDKHRFDHVYHLAAYAAEGLSHFIRRFNYTNNVIGSVNLINASIMHDVKCFVFTSSIAVYGEGQSPMLETMTPRPEDPYGVAKFAIEMDLQAAGRLHGLNHVIFRPHNVYGEYQNIGDKYRNVVGIFMNQILEGRPLSIFGDGTQQRAFSYVGDIVSPMVRCTSMPGTFGQIYNIGADQPYSVNALAQAVISVMDIDSHPIVHLDPRDEVHVAYSDHSKVRQTFGQSAVTPLGVGLEKMARWVRESGSRQSQEFSNIEVPRNLPASWVRTDQQAVKPIAPAAIQSPVSVSSNLAID